MTGKKTKPATSNISRRRKTAMAEAGPDYMAKRAELIRIAAGLFKTNGFKETTFNDISIHTDLDRATLYYYFGSKQEIFEGAISGALTRNLQGLAVIMSETGKGPIEKLRDLVEMLMVSYSENYPYLFVYLQQDLHTIVDQKSAWAKRVRDETKTIENAFKTRRASARSADAGGNPAHTDVSG
jgi:AcrR family transcriptional regulator